MLAKLAKIEARLQMIEATQSKNDFNFDNTALSQAKKTVSDLEERLDVMARRAEIEGRYGDLDGPSTYVDPHRDIVKEVDEQFGPSDSRPARQVRRQEPLRYDWAMARLPAPGPARSRFSSRA